MNVIRFSISLIMVSSICLSDDIFPGELWFQTDCPSAWWVLPGFFTCKTLGLFCPDAMAWDNRTIIWTGEFVLLNSSAFLDAKKNYWGLSWAECVTLPAKNPCLAIMSAIHIIKHVVGSMWIYRKNDFGYPMKNGISPWTYPCAGSGLSIKKEFGKSFMNYGKKG